MAGCGVSEMIFRVPVVVIMGATGAGKSKLAIDIAKKFGGEVISADSMQVYRGLDIITNKVTAEEAQGVPHHLLDFLEPSQRFSVVDFRDAALPIIDNLLSRQKLPVVVGGTHYYIEALLWKVLVADGPPDEATKRPHGLDSTSDSEGEDAVSEAILKRKRGAGDPEELRSVSSEELHRRLKMVDPEMADTLHPNNRRRIIRSLQVFRQLGRKHSEVLKEQRAAAGGSSLGGPLRHPHSIILWPQCDQETLDARLDSRVDEMMRRGLVAELEDVHRRYNQQRLRDHLEADYTEGIFQSIGFKEFHSWLVQPEPARRSDSGQAEMRRCAEALKAATRRYARKQLRWIRNRFLRRPDRQVPPVYAVDTTEPALWEELVATPALSIVDAHLRGAPPLQSPLPVEEPLAHQEGTFHCADCDRVFVGAFQWRIHLSSKKHARRAKKKPTLQPTKAQEKDTPEEGLLGQDPPEEGLMDQDPPEAVPKVDPPEEMMAKEEPQEEVVSKGELPEELMPKEGLLEKGLSKEDRPDGLPRQSPAEKILPKEDPPMEEVPKEDQQVKNIPLDNPQEKLVHTEGPQTSGSGSAQQHQGDDNEPLSLPQDQESLDDPETKHQVPCAREGSPVPAITNGTTSPKRD